MTTSSSHASTSTSAATTTRTTPDPASAQGTGQTSKKPTYTFTFHLTPLNSPIGRILITELDNELSEMYADFLPGGKYRGSPSPEDQPASTRPLEDAAASTEILSSLEEAKERDDVRFLVAYAMRALSPSTTPTTTTAPPPPHATPAGCAALLLHPIPSTPPFPPTSRLGELRRMYIRPAYRGSGLSHLLMDAFASCGRGEGLDKLVLVTGYRQRAARRVYERCGWRRRELWGKFLEESRKPGREEWGDEEVPGGLVGMELDLK